MSHAEVMKELQYYWLMNLYSPEDGAIVTVQIDTPFSSYNYYYCFAHIQREFNEYFGAVNGPKHLFFISRGRHWLNFRDIILLSREMLASCKFFHINHSGRYYGEIYNSNQDDYEQYEELQAKFEKQNFGGAP